MAIDEAMIKWTGRLSFKKYLPPKPTKRGIKIWMRCDSVNAFLIDFEIYLRKRNTSIRTWIGNEVVTRLTRDITVIHFRVYSDNYFTSVQLMVDLLADKIYVC